MKRERKWEWKFTLPVNRQFCFNVSSLLRSGKVMFLHLSVILFTGAGCVWQPPPGQTPGRRPLADTPRQTPPGRHPPGQITLSRHPLSRHPDRYPWADTPFWQTPFWQTAPRQTPPLVDTPTSRTLPPPPADTPWADTPSRRLTQRTVRILLVKYMLNIWMPVSYKHFDIK